MQRTNDIDVKIEEGRFIAERIKGARFVEFDGSDHLFWVGNSREVLEEMKSFITSARPALNYEERLFTIVAARIISTPDSHDAPELIGRLVTQYRGKIVEYSPNDFTAIFEGPSKGVHCSIDLINALRSANTRLAVGIHIREGAVHETHFVSGKTQSFNESILKHANPDQILITQAVTFLLSGAGINFANYKTVLESTSGKSLSLFVVTDHLVSGAQPDSFSQKQLRQSDSFLENVLQSIDHHMGNDSYGVENLCKDVGISERQLQRKLKAITNKSPNQLITSVRLHRAKELILGTENNITEIAFQTGFTSPSYFSKCFKKEFGISPSSFVQNQH
jgi:AraC-like DNA-binding protein